jgi:hypothetical protein
VGGRVGAGEGRGMGREGSLRRLGVSDASKGSG